MLHRGVEAYGTKSFDAISLDFVNSFRSKNNNAGMTRNWGVVTLNPSCSPFSVSVDTVKNALVWKESIVIDHRGLLSLDPFTKGLELTALKGNGCPVICFAREDYRVITPSESRVLKITLALKTRKHLASRITFQDLQDWEMTCHSMLFNLPIYEIETFSLSSSK